MFIISQGLGSRNECAYQVTSHRLLASNRLIELLAEAQQRLCERRMWRRRSVGEVSEACHNKHIRQELSVPSAESSYGIREGFEKKESYQLKNSVKRRMLARATSSVEKNSQGKVDIRNSHFLSALPEGLVGNFQRAVAQQVIIGGLRNRARMCLPFKSPDDGTAYCSS